MLRLIEHLDLRKDLKQLIITHGLKHSCERERERVIDIRRTIILNSFVKKIQIIVVFVCIYSVIPTYVYMLLLNSGTYISLQTLKFIWFGRSKQLSKDTSK